MRSLFCHSLLLPRPTAIFSFCFPPSLPPPPPPPPPHLPPPPVIYTITTNAFFGLFLIAPLILFNLPPPPPTPPPPHPICQCVSVYLSGWANRMTDGQTDKHVDMQTEGPPFPQKEAK